MGIRKWIRESIFGMVRRDLATFLQEHQADMLVIFHEELQRLDDDIPEEKLFIDIKMAPLGDAILKSALRAITRFLTE